MIMFDLIVGIVTGIAVGALIAIEYFSGRNNQKRDKKGRFTKE